MGDSNLNTKDTTALGWTAICAGFLLTIFAVILWFNSPFRYASGEPRPVLLVTGLFVLASLVALCALKSALRIEGSTHKLWWLIIIVAFIFRGVFLFSNPILEIDYYRYVWDGKVLNEGVSPYRFSPQQVLNSTPSGDSSYQQVAALANESPSNNTILTRVHFGEFTTIYPPVSQAVFMLATRWVSPTASVETHIFWMKFTLVMFDIGTLWLTGVLLLRLNRHVGWLLVYAWNPLVIKEVANSGHLDSIAVFFLIAATYSLVRILQSQTTKQSVSWLASSALFLGMGVGAKLFPVVLFPAFAIAITKQSWRASLLFTLIFLVTVSACLAPMFLTSPKWQTKLGSTISDRNETNNLESRELNEETSKEGLSSFLSKWRMNDVIFSGLYRNVKPDSPSGREAPWYVFVPNRIRKSIRTWCQQQGIGGDNPAFAIARGLSLFLFALIYLLMIGRLKRGQPDEIISALLVLLATFLFLQPTVNPWYWLWVLPLVCFTQNSGWLFVSTWLFLYYTRFWFKSLEGEYQLLGESFSGAGLFDHGVAWIEFALILIGLAIGHWWKLQPRNNEYLRAPVP